MSLLFPNAPLTFRRMKVMKPGINHFSSKPNLLIALCLLAAVAITAQSWKPPKDPLDFDKPYLLRGDLYVLSGRYVEGGWAIGIQHYDSDHWERLGSTTIDTIAVDFAHHEYYPTYTFGMIADSCGQPCVYYRKFNGKSASAPKVKRYTGCDWENVGPTSLDESVSFMGMKAAPDKALYLSYLRWQGRGYVPVVRKLMDGEWANVGQLPMEGYYGAISFTDNGRPCYQYTCGNLLKLLEFDDNRWREVLCIALEE